MSCFWQCWAETSWLPLWLSSFYFSHLKQRYLTKWSRWLENCNFEKTFRLQCGGWLQCRRFEPTPLTQPLTPWLPGSGNSDLIWWERIASIWMTGLLFQVPQHTAPQAKDAKQGSTSLHKRFHKVCHCLKKNPEFCEIIQLNSDGVCVKWMVWHWHFWQDIWSLFDPPLFFNNGFHFFVF